MSEVDHLLMFKDYLYFFLYELFFPLPFFYWVLGLHTKENVLYVAKKDTNDYLISDECIIDSVNLISIHHPTFCTAKFRYHSKEIPVILEYLSNNQIRVKYVDMAGYTTYLEITKRRFRCKECNKIFTENNYINNPGKKISIKLEQKIL